jgi:predicted outer membrane repeat protein
MKKRVLFGLFAAMAVLFASCGNAGGGDSGTNDPGPDEPGVVAVTSVTLNTGSLILRVEDSADLIATVLPADAADKLVTWKSSNTGVATVVNGTVTGVAEGSATITVTTADGNKTATCTVTVTVDPSIVQVTSVSIGTATLQLDEEEGFWITEGESADLTVAVEPGNATNTAVQWMSSDTSVVTVDEAGRVTGVAGGSATIIVTTVSGGKTDTCAITVKPRVTSVVLDQTHLVLGTGVTADLTATVLPVDAANQSVTWESSDNNVATVDENGRVTGVAMGSATITVTTADGDKTATCTVDVPFTFTAVTNPTEWSNAFSAISSAEGGSEGSPRIFELRITGDFNADEGSITGRYKKVWLTGDGTISLSSNGSLIKVMEDQTFVIDGPTLQGKADNDAALVHVGIDPNHIGTLEFRSGRITGNSSSNLGGGVLVLGGIFTMTGGTISGNTAVNASDETFASGGGVYVGGRGTFTMTGGTISENTAGGAGGGVASENSTFTMKGGTISGNTAVYGTYGGIGGGVYAVEGSFTMEGGLITGNTTNAGIDGAGGGLYVFNDEEEAFLMKGGTISSNTAVNGGGVFVSGGLFTMEDGFITNNTATESGGGVYSWGTFTVTGGTVSGNTAPSGNDVYVPDPDTE